MATLFFKKYCHLKLFLFQVTPNFYTESVGIFHPIYRTIGLLQTKQKLLSNNHNKSKTITPVPEKMLHCVVIEVRQHLCCANVFLKFEQSLTDSESIKINVDEHKVELQNPNCHAAIIVDKYFSILPGTFSNLVVDYENASFRISIQDIEIPDVELKKEYVKFNLQEHEEAALSCKNCNSILCGPQKYKKIREFPSGAIDVSEFFCHHGPSFKDVLVPGTLDLFYGFHFVVLNNKDMQNTREKEGHLYCKRCLKYLGETMFNEKAVKLWSDSIIFGLNGQHLDVFDTKDKSIVQQLLLKVIKESSLPSPEPLLRNMHFTKVLLEASLPDRQNQYLLVQILEKHLPVLRNLEAPTQAGLENVQLNLYQAFKILYRLIPRQDIDNDDISSLPPLLEYWQNDINILKMKISPFLFSALIEELNANILLLPEIYRTTNDDFLLSYIFY